MWWWEKPFPLDKTEQEVMCTDIFMICSGLGVEKLFIILALINKNKAKLSVDKPQVFIFSTKLFLELFFYISKCCWKSWLKNVS